MSTSAVPSRPELFRCEVRRAGVGFVSVEPIGELDGATIDTVRGALLAARAPAPGVMVVDLRGLGFMDSAGLHAILDTATWARDAGVELVIVPGSRAVRRIFEITGTDRMLQLADRPPATLRPAGG